MQRTTPSLRRLSQGHCKLGQRVLGGQEKMTGYRGNKTTGTDEVCCVDLRCSN